MAIKLETDFWDDKKHVFNKLLLLKATKIKKEYEVKYEIEKEIDLTLNNFYIAQAFKELSKFITTKEVLNTDKEDSCIWYQFGVIFEGNLTPIKWFTLVINDKLQLHNDIAFHTPLIEKNSLQIPFGKFPMHREYQVSKHNEFKMKRNVYNYIANQIAKC